MFVHAYVYVCIRMCMYVNVYDTPHTRRPNTLCSLFVSYTHKTRQRARSVSCKRLARAPVLYRYMYRYMYVYLYEYVSVCVYVSVSVKVSVSVSVSICLYLYEYVYVDPYVYVYACVRVDSSYTLR